MSINPLVAELVPSRAHREAAVTAAMGGYGPPWSADCARWIETGEGDFPMWQRIAEAIARFSHAIPSQMPTGEVKLTERLLRDTRAFIGFARDCRIEEVAYLLGARDLTNYSHGHAAGLAEMSKKTEQRIHQLEIRRREGRALLNRLVKLIRGDMAIPRFEPLVRTVEQVRDYLNRTHEPTDILRSESGEEPQNVE